MKQTYNTNYYWTLGEAVKQVYGLEVLEWSSITFKNIFYSLYPNAPLWTSTNATKPYIEDLWALSYARLKEHYLGITESDTLSTADATRFLLNIINVIIITYPRYSSLLKAYEDKKDTLLASIRSSTEGKTRYNDTPQNVEVDDDFENDKHVTNITKASTSSETDGGSAIARIKEIQDAFENQLLNWSNELDRVLLEESNVNE